MIIQEEKIEIVEEKKVPLNTEEEIETFKIIESGNEKQKQEAINKID